MPRLWVVIVNYRTAELVVSCLKSLQSEIELLEGIRVLIVDNDSGDGSVGHLTDHIKTMGWTTWADVIPMERNGGFAFGNNVGIRLAIQDRADYVMLLNPDTIVRPSALRTLSEFMDANPQAGIAGTLLENPKGGVDCSAHRAHSPLSELDGGARLGILSRLLRRFVVSDNPKAFEHLCDWVSGASMIVRRKVIDEIGLMDEGFFLYFEEVDFCWRAKQAGWEVWYVPQSRVLHLEGASTGINAPGKRRAGYWYDSRRRFFIKHYGITGLLLADLLWSVGRVSLLLRGKLGLGGKGIELDPKWFMSDLLGGDLRSILTGKAWSIRRELGR